MNDTAESFSQRWRALAGAVLTLVSTTGLPLPANAALTDLSPTPLAANAAAQTKPNIMLLMDASGSMGWGHMPDEVESVTGIGSIGYKSAQCNVLYYNPRVAYILPKLADGTFFPTPSFNAAPYAGYVSFYTAPDGFDTSIVDLSSSFRAYDQKTLRATTSVPADPAQPAYYYVYSGAQTLTYASPPCTQSDVNASVAATGGGNWTRVLVSATSGQAGSPDERANFAIWYSFYRTRLSLIKSAASLAFTPLTDSFRVGFITVEPKDNPTDTTIDAARYVPIADFNTPQRGLWFGKLFSQSAQGASPAREGLARVGRYYAGMQDGINTGMTGDPMQYSCQQNFTIMTTDGYWNAQTETPGAGPVMIDGFTPVGQQDGILTPPSGLSPRPIWEGFITDGQLVTDNNDQFSYAPCGTYFLTSTAQASQSTAQTIGSTSQLVQRTVQTTASTVQTSLSTSQMTQSTLQHQSSTSQTMQSTSQLSQSTSQLTKSTSQLQQVITQLQQRRDRIQQSTSQLTMATSQLTQSTSQLTQNTLQTRIQTSQINQSTTQITASTSQITARTSQLNSSTSQVNVSTLQQTQSTAQVSQSTSQDRICDARDESCSAVAVGTCSASGFFYCETDTTGPTLVASCTPAAASPANLYVTTTCSSVNTGPTAVASCTPAAAGPGNSFVATTCNSISTGPTPVAACTASLPVAGNGYTTTTCNTLTGPLTPTGSCSVTLASPGNSYTATNCTTVLTGPTGVASCSTASANSGNNYTATTCNTVNTGPTGVASCTGSAANAGNSYMSTTCNTVNTGPTPVSSCTGAAAATGNSWVATSCNTVTTGPTPIAACSPIGAVSGNNWTTTTCPNVVGTAVGVASCATAPGNAGNSYTATTCNTINTGPTGVASCTGAVAGPGNSYTSTSCNTVNTGPSGAASCTGAPANAGDLYTSTTCNTVTTGPTPIASCSPIGASSGNNYTATTCATLVVQNWTNVGTCTPVAPVAGNTFTSTSCQTVNGTATGVATCTPSAPNGGGQGVTCNTATSGPVGVQTCTPQTGNSGNQYLNITCATVNTGPTLVASCNPAVAAVGNQWTATTCANATTGPTAVASCTAQVAGAGNSYIATTCTNNTTGPTGVSSCTPIAAAPGNSYTATTCNDATTGPTAMATCSVIPASAGNQWIDTSCLTNNTGPTLVAACAPIAAGAGNAWTATTCSSATTGPTPVSSCTTDAPVAGNSYVSTTCNTITSPDAGMASCTPVAATALNNWTETQCATLTSSGGTQTCTPMPANAGNSWTATTCTPNNTGPTLVASCVPSAGGAGNDWTTTSCNVATTGPTVVGSCTPQAADIGNNFIQIICAAVAGKKTQYTTTTTLTTTQFNNGTQIGAPVVTTSTGSAVDLDGVCYAPGTEPALPAPNPQEAGLIAGPYPPAGCGAWPCSQSTSNTGGSINSLADVAQYYYATDLRPGMVDNVTPVGNGPEDDRATWQHMTTFVVGLGVSGTLNYRPDYKSTGVTTGDFAEIRAGTRAWPTWPDPTLNYVPPGGSYANWNDPRSIDDFWHTAVNGRGTFFSAGDPGSVIAGLSNALSGTQNRIGSGAGVAVSNTDPVAGDNFVYSPSYQTGNWVGDVQASQIDPMTGTLSATVDWSAQTLLDASTGAACDNRQIYLFHMGAANNRVNFSSNTRTCDAAGNPTGPSDTGLNAAEMANFGPANAAHLGQYFSMTDGSGGTVDQRSAASGDDLVNFLRGQRGLEGFVANDLTKLYRDRTHVLGDIVGGQPVYVKAPFASYQDTNYAAFQSANAGRDPMLYVPANDGMLHAFYAGSTPTTAALGGKERWAFMPTSVLPNLYKLADIYYKNNHQFYVDGTPVVGDAYDGSNWKTILVGGLNAGGKEYYAIDVTDPASPKGLWEFKWSNVCYDGTPATAGSDCEIGYTYGQPIISKLNDGTWVVMFTSGYNNVNTPPQGGDGVGYLYVLNAFTGQIIYRISTGAGNGTTPSGLAQINNFVDLTDVNNTTRQVYGGDLLGNIWRFDVNDSIAPAGREAALIGVATDASNAPQPITTRPELAELNALPLVFVGTGQLLGASDFSNGQGQSVYGIVDPLTPATVYPSLRSVLRPLAMTQTGAIRTVACTGLNPQCGSPDGWVVDLPDPGERVNVNMDLVRGTLVFASNVPSDTACTTGGYSWLNFLSFSSGLAVTSANANLSVSVQSTNSLAVGVNVVGVQGRLIGIRRFTDANNVNQDPIPFDTPGPAGKRISWREIAQ